MTDEKLRTLKDMEEIAEESNIRYAVITQSLRHQARIWLRKIDEVMQNGEEVDYEDELPDFMSYKHLDDWKGHLLSVRIWIKNFFNITEKDRPPRQEGFAAETEQICELIKSERGDQRIGQFLINAITTHENEDVETALWNIEADELLGAMRELIKLGDEK